MKKLLALILSAVLAVGCFTACSTPAESTSEETNSESEVVETVEDALCQISLDDAKKISGTYEIGDVVNVEEKPADFGRLFLTQRKTIAAEMRKLALVIFFYL